jgi:hypothetical protein
MGIRTIFTLFFSLFSASLLAGNDGDYEKKDSCDIHVKKTKRVYRTQHINQPLPKIDGRLDDACWVADGEWTGNFVQQQPVEGAPPTQKTEFKILYDKEYLYVGMRAYETEPDKINFRPAKRDDFAGDMVGIAFDSYYDKRTSFEFDLTVSGGKIDLLLLNDELDMDWNAVWEGKSALEDSAWTAEMKIPLSQLRYSKENEQVWGLHAWRWISRNHEENNWVLLPRDSPARINEFGTLTGLTGLKKSKRLELMPYAVTSWTKSEKEPGNPFAKGNDLDLSCGLDGKLGITSNFTMDVTINPDFGQVEADPSILNLTAFETFYEEKRPFFLEGKNILEFRLGRDMLFYSRRIGSQPSYYPEIEDNEFVFVPENTRILSAVKVTGKNQNGLSVGIMQSTTAREFLEIKSSEGQIIKETAEPLTSYFVSRIQKDMNDANTILGGIFTSTNRKLVEDHLDFMNKGAYTGGLDFIHQWKNKTYFVALESVFSHITGDEEAITEIQHSSVRYLQRPDFKHLGVDTTRTSLNGTGIDFDIGKAGNGRWRYRLSMDYKSPNLELNDIGYNHMADLISESVSVEYIINDPFSIFRTLSFSLRQGNYWNLGGYYLSSDLNTSLHAQFINLWRSGYELRREFEGLDSRKLRGGPAFMDAGSWSQELEFLTDYSKKVAFRLNMETELSDDKISKQYVMRPGITVKMGNNIELSSTLMYNMEKENLQYVNMLELEYDDDYRYIMAYLDRKTMSLTLRADYGITPDLTIQYYGSPYISSGQYSDFKHITDSRASDYFDRYHSFTRDEITYNPDDNLYYIDETQDGTDDYAFDNPDFNFRQFRSNLVARWEYKPGSIFYLVWTHSRTSYENETNPSFAHNFENLWDVYPTNVFLVKLNYWFSL